jgi:GWxTD domain-containing protein
VNTLIAGDPETRRQAERMLTRYLRGAPSDAGALLLLGRLYLAQGRLTPARRTFQRLLRLDPARPEAHRELGFLWMREWAEFFDRRRLQRAVEDLEQSMPPANEGLSPEQWRALAALGALYCEQGVPERAASLLAARVDSTPSRTSAWAHLSLAMSHHALGRASDAAREFGAGIAALGGVDRRGYEDVRPVCAESERQEFSDLSLEDRPAWLRAFWRRHDPTPTTAENEFQLEFYRRVTVAFLFFRLPGARWWDARGDVYVRFGAPDVVDTVEGDTVEPSFEVMHVILPDQILWRYRQLDLDVRLAATNFDGLYTFPFPTRVLLTDPYLRYHVMPMEASKPLDSRHNEIGWDPAADFIKRTSEARDLRGQAALDRGAFAIRIDMRKTIIPYASAHAAFDAGDGKIREVVSFAVSERTLRDATTSAARRQLTVAYGDSAIQGAPSPRAADAQQGARELTATAVLFDAEWREVDRAERRGPFARAPSVDGPLAVAQVELTAPPGHYYLATSLEDSAAIGSHREGIRAPEIPPGCAASEVELTFPADVGRPVQALLPNPGGVVGQGQPLSLYFEVYNLSRDLRGEARASVQTTVRPLRSLKPPLPGTLRRPGGLVTKQNVPDVIATSFTDVVRSSTLTRTLVLDVNSLPAGEYEIELVITDGGTDMKASTRTTFRKSGSPARSE